MGKTNGSKGLTEKKTKEACGVFESSPWSSAWLDPDGSVADKTHIYW